MKIVFLNLGRTGASTRFALELARASERLPELDVGVVISSACQNAAAFAPFGPRLLLLDTFDRTRPLALVHNFPRAKRTLLAWLAHHRPDVVVTVMPHAWTPLLARPIRKLGIRYATIIHDAVVHPGDRLSMITPWLLSEIKPADLVITLSRTVTTRLAERRGFRADRIATLFHPDLAYPGMTGGRSRPHGRPLRLLFLGRILPYKGLRLLVDAAASLRAAGILLQLGVAGAGNLEAERSDLEALGAEIVNRWLGDEEIGPILSRYDALVLPYIEASQSGVAAVAFANAMPVIATPVGGLAEQVVDGKTGLLATGVNLQAFVAAIRRLALDDGLYDQIVDYLQSEAPSRSMTSFASRLSAAVLAPQS